MFNIKEELKKLPDRPGVYIMRDESNEIIYIGKAINLKNRVRQYFQSSKNHSPKVRAMVSRIDHFEYIITDSELEALILECNLIKKHRPRYNILLKDDKHYPYIKVTMNEDFPRILFVRRMDKDGAKYFGPYSSTGYVNDTIEIIKKIFPIRSCRKVFPRDIGKERPCLNFHIGQCLAPCQGSVNKNEYKSMMKDVCLFLGGKHQELVVKLEDEMKISSESLDFERAAELRDKINSIKHISEKQKIISTVMGDQDVIAFASGKGDTIVQVFFIRGGKLLGRENFTLDGVEETSRSKILCEFIKQFYSHTDFVPKEILLQEEVDEINIIETWLSTKRGSKVQLRVPRKGEKHELVDMVYKNALQELESLEGKIKDKNIGLEELSLALGTDRIPNRIEAYDISNIQGSLSVGAMIVFTNGRPDKSQYRKFKIKSVEGPNDYQSMQEVLFRRFTNKNENFLGKPDLLCIDGGKGHVNSAQEVLQSLNYDIPVCGMVKDAKHKTRGLIYKDKEINIKDKPKLLTLITNIQDEVHRFAITYHKSLREKQLKKSILDEVEGIGPKRKMILLKHFKSIDNIRKASIDEISKVEGFNRQIAEKVYNFFIEK